ncbi:hypothetical protein D1007_12620 [Hordeum vulgare]|nr:hypothetical protein D1007_12620 [Hordeum vulgare]
MSSTGDGGEKGGAGEAPTHPKSPGTDEMVPKRDRRDQIALLEEIDNTSNWDERASMGLDGPDVRVDGVVDFDDDVVAEEEPEAEEGAAPPRWRLLGRYVSLGRPNVDDMTEHVSKVWKVRTGLNIARIKNNWYAITFFSEGDHKFVARGGPWIYKGNALTVGPFRAGEQLSEAELNSVPVWVRAYIVPWDKQTIAYGAFLGGLLGKTMEVDAEADGSRVPEFLHIRIDLSLSRRLQTKITVGREPAKQVIYPLRYERVPHYCFWCGFIGHDDNQCEKKRLGVPTRAYDEGLRCSPYHKYENRSAFVASGAQTAAKRGLNFVSNAPSEVLGQPRESHRGRRNQQQQQTRDIPIRVDARDGFGERYSGAGTNVDADLADRVKSMCVHLDGQKTMISHGRCNRATSEPPEFVFLGGRVPDPLPFSVHPGSSTSHSSRLGSSDMILAIRGLGNSMEFSQSDSDQHMQEADSVLGKRFMRGISGEEVSSGEGGEEPDGKKPVGSKQKRGKLLCPRAVELWRAMALVWRIPNLEDVHNTRPEWALHLLASCDEGDRLRLSMLLWRCWFVRNEIVHDKPAPPIEASRNFLQSYVTSILGIQQFPMGDWDKGKMVIQDGAEQPAVQGRAATGVNHKWLPPPESWSKLNVHGSYNPNDGTAGAGMVLRDHNGYIIFSACRSLWSCPDAHHAELAGCMEGLALDINGRNFQLSWNVTAFKPST